MTNDSVGLIGPCGDGSPCEHFLTKPTRYFMQNEKVTKRSLFRSSIS